MNLDMIIYIGKIVGAIVIICGFLGTIINYMKKAAKLTEKIEKMLKEENNYQNQFDIINQDAKKRQELLLAIARIDLLRKFDEILTRGNVTLDEYTVVQKLYEAYVDNGGNSVIVALWKRVQKIKIVNDNNE